MGGLARHSLGPNVPAVVVRHLRFLFPTNLGWVSNDPAPAGGGVRSVELDSRAPARHAADASPLAVIVSVGRPPGSALRNHTCRPLNGRDVTEEAPT